MAEPLPRNTQPLPIEFSAWELKHPPDPRFWAKVQKTDSCWLWTGARMPRGYGIFTIGSKVDGTHRNVYAHRWLYERLIGAVAPGFELDHLCRNPSCVRPDHLEVVTHKENCLRGESPIAQNHRKTSCPNGHEYTSANTYNSKDGSRRCRTCNRDHKRREWARKRTNDTAS